MSDLGWVQFTIPALVGALVSWLAALHIQRRFFKKKSLQQPVDEALRRLDELLGLCIEEKNRFDQYGHTDEFRVDYIIAYQQALIEFFNFISNHYKLKHSVSHLASDFFLTLGTSHPNNFRKIVTEKEILIKTVHLRTGLYKNI